MPRRTPGAHSSRLRVGARLTRLASISLLRGPTRPVAEKARGRAPAGLKLASPARGARRSPQFSSECPWLTREAGVRATSLRVRPSVAGGARGQGLRPESARRALHTRRRRVEPSLAPTRRASAGRVDWALQTRPAVDRVSIWRARDAGI